MYAETQRLVLWIIRNVARTPDQASSPERRLRLPRAKRTEFCSNDLFLGRPKETVQYSFQIAKIASANGEKRILLQHSGHCRQSFS